MVEISNIQKKEKKEIILTIRTTKSNKQWLDKNNISPTKLFNEAIIDLKEKLKQNIHRKKCVICKEPSKKLNLGLGLSTSSFCSEKCLKTYTTNNPKGEGLEVSGTNLYVV